MKQQILKQVVGIDVAQNELVCSFAALSLDLQTSHWGVKTFKNSKEGIAKLIVWAEKLAKSNDSNTSTIHYVCEATGVYHELLVYTLHELMKKVSVVLPNKISNYIKTLEIKTVTDFTCAEAIAQFGLSRALAQWVKPNATYKILRHLTRERDQIITERTTLKNQLHAEKAQAEPHKASIERTNKRIALLNKQEKSIQEELKKIVNDNEAIKQQVATINTIPGLGMLTAVIILAETNGFELIKNLKQLSSYAGFDVVEKQSGTSVKGKPRISKRGNKYLRKALHLPALSAIKNNTEFRVRFARLVNKHNIKMKAAVAVQRKMLELSYVLVSKNEAYKMPEILQQQTSEIADIINEKVSIE